MSFIKLDKSSIEEIFPLTSLQEGMLFHYLTNTDTREYLEMVTFRFKEEIDFEMFQQAWSIVVRQNEMLRTVFRWDDLKNPVQVVLKSKNVNIVFLEENSLEGDSFLNDLGGKTLSLEEVPFQIYLVKRGPKIFDMTILNHHILYDGWSNAILFREFVQAYVSQKTSENYQLSTKNKFSRFVGITADKKLSQASTEFWTSYLKGFEGQSFLPIKNRNEDIQNSQGQLKLSISDDNFEMMNSYIQNQKLTISTLLYTIWGIILQKYQNSYDVIFGCTVSGRSAAIDGITNMVGLFINTVPLRIARNENVSVVDLLNTVQKMLVERAPFEQISLTEIHSITGVHNLGGLFDTIFVVENYPFMEILKDENSLDFELLQLRDITNYDLTVSASFLRNNNVDICFNYKNGAFAKSAISDLALTFDNILLQIISSKIDLVRDLSQSDVQMNLLLSEFNATDAAFPFDKTLIELFKEQVLGSPDDVAVIFEDESITYFELNRRCNQLSNYIRKKGVRREVLVGICIERSIDMIVGILAILNAGGAYVPISLEYPEERIKYILTDTGVDIVLTSSKSFRHVDVSKNAELVCLDSDWTKIELESDENRISDSKPEDLAYVIYTSGSTGKPKGVMIENRGVVNRIDWMWNYYSFKSGDVVLQKTSYAFDVSVWEIFLPLCWGSKMILCSDKSVGSPDLLFSLIERHNISCLHFVPSMFDVFINALKENGNLKSKLKSLRLVITSGEVLKLETVRRWYSEVGVPIFNLYGPTEASIDVTHFTTSGNDNIIPIGRPIFNTKIDILGVGGDL